MLFMLLASCGSQKETAASKGLQNLTARYNILYNANEMLDESERNILLAYQDDYARLIPVYTEPDEALAQAELKKLDDVIAKANTIVNEKSQSNYVDDAYFLIARANHLKANFFNAAEFFTYIYNSYPKETALRQTALAWKARSLMQLERFEEAENTLDTAMKNMGDEKNTVADIYASRVQLHLYAQQDEEAIALLQKAIKLSGDKQKRVRWTYLLAQLQQLTGKPQLAYANYTTVIKSNAPFDMAFNANLNRISIEDEQSGREVNREERLRALLKDEKSKDFTDQIYYEIGNYHEERNEQDKAVESYNSSVRSSTKNTTQKGLSYLKIAEIYFKKAEYVQSKAYYDSTLKALPVTYPDYEQIKTKGLNLELLAEGLTTIAREDTLQMLARLPENERENRLAALTQQQVENTGAATAQNAGLNNLFEGNEQVQTTSATKDGKFYFDNSTAISQGFSDFKKRWGNRKLEDNWRRNEKSAANITNVPLTQDDPDVTTPTNPDAAVEIPVATAGISAVDIPLTAEQLAASDQRIINALYDIGNYYREIINDEPEAIKTFEALLKRYPDNNNKLAVYYNLYRLYNTVDPQKSNEYKNILLIQYPNSPFAKVINDPDYNQKTDGQELALNRFYNQAYDAYTARKYNEVLALTTKVETQVGANTFAPQFAYLNALATGHTQQLKEFEEALVQIVTKFPADKLIVPLVKLHLTYIDSNRIEMYGRSFALLDYDPNEPRFVEEPENQPVVTTVLNQSKSSTGDKQKQAEQPEPVSESGTTEPAEKPVADEKPVINSTEFAALPDSAEYYYVINVLNPSVNLSSSRFGVGQFNRTNFSGEGIKHQLKGLNNENQLIFVGVFSSRGTVSEYDRNITPLLPQIMKIPADEYNTFIVTKNTLDKLTDRQTVNRYINYYTKNY